MTYNTNSLKLDKKGILRSDTCILSFIYAIERKIERGGGEGGGEEEEGEERDENEEEGEEGEVWMQWEER